MQVEREIRIHGKLNHNNIIKLFAAFEDAENVYLAQEFASGEAGHEHSALRNVGGGLRLHIKRFCVSAGGDLYEDLKANGGLIAEARVAEFIIYPCMLALSYLHKLVGSVPCCPEWQQDESPLLRPSGG